jgi:hypothetical protein
MIQKALRSLQTLERILMTQTQSQKIQGSEVAYPCDVHICFADLLQEALLAACFHTGPMKRRTGKSIMSTSMLMSRYKTDTYC